MGMRFVSTFTGVGMFDLGLMQAGMECIHQVEIDEHCQAVLRRQFPDVPKSKDIYEVSKSANSFAGSTFDLLVGGSPCQSFSVAGRRLGLEGESQLWYEYHRLLEEYRPTWFIWENVPGVLSSGPVINDAGDKLAGYDFSVILTGFTGSYQRIPDKGWKNSGVANGPFYNVAWRVLDARHWGVAQRRRRIFVIGRLAAAGGSPAEILFERESTGWHTQPGRSARKGTAAAAGSAARGSRAGSGNGTDLHAGAAHSLSPYDVAPTLPASGAGTARPSITNAADQFLAITAFQESGPGGYSEEDVAGTLRVCEWGGGPRLQNLVATAFRMRAFGDYVEEQEAASAIAARDYKDARDIVAMTLKPNRRFFDQETNQWCVIDNDGAKRIIDQSLAPKPQAVDVRNLTTSEEISGTLQHKKSGGYSLNYQNPVIVPKYPIAESHDAVVTFNGDPTPKLQEDIAPPLRSGQGGEGVGVISRMFGIRRFTPVETERLQGLPDDWTRWRDDGRELSDAQRYAQCGNGGAVPVLKWLGERIMAYKED